jgi:hypothetical protein
VAKARIAGFWGPDSWLWLRSLWPQPAKPMAMASVAMMSPVQGQWPLMVLAISSVVADHVGRFSARAERDATSLVPVRVLRLFRYSLYIPCHEKS